MALTAALVVSLAVVGDGIPQPLTTTPGDAVRGQAIVADRQQGLCLLCHTGPFPQPQLHGTLASDLRGAGSRWSEAQLRLRIADARRLDPHSLMPALHKADAGARVGAAHRGKPVLDAQQVEDVVAYLKTLR
jgi:L-cysteine S-thiosulfotransferase